MKLTRKQELALIEIGLEMHLNKTLFEKLSKREIKRKAWNIGKKWSRKQHKKFAETMKAKWNSKRSKK